MIGFESDIKRFLKDKNIDFTDNCTSYKKLDFTFNNFFNERNLHVDVKEKRQKISILNWPSIAEDKEAYAFIIDDMAVRKTIAYAPYSGLIIRNNLTMYYYWLSVMDLGMMPKQRVNRPIEKNELHYKGKWIIDLRNAIAKNTLDEIFDVIKLYCEDVFNISTRHLPCYGNYINENISIEGAIRKPSYWNKDVKETR